MMEVELVLYAITLKGGEGAGGVTVCKSIIYIIPYSIQDIPSSEVRWLTGSL